MSLYTYVKEEGKPLTTLRIARILQSSKATVTSVTSEELIERFCCSLFPLPCALLSSGLDRSRGPGSLSRKRSGTQWFGQLCRSDCHQCRWRVLRPGQGIFQFHFSGHPLGYR